MYDGFHTELLYSTVLRTNPLFKHRNATLSIYLKFLLMIPNMLYGCFVYPFMYVIVKL